MIGSIYLVFYFLTILVSGYAVLSLVLNGKSRSFLETVSLTMLLGAGTVSVFFFWFSLMGLKPTRGVIFAIFVFFLVVLSLRKKNEKGLPSFKIPGKITKKDLPFFLICGVALCYLLGIVTVDALLMPLYQIDSYTLWCLKAKAIYHEGLVDGGLFHQLSLSYSHLNYPLLVPFLISGVYASVGHPQDSTVKIIFPFLYVAGMLFIYSSLRWKLERKPALILTLLYLSLPAALQWCSAGTADAPLTVFYAGSIFYLIKYLAEERKEDLFLSLLLSFFCAFVKNEGVVIAGLNIAVLAVFHLSFRSTLKRLKTVFFYAIGIALLLLPWFWWTKGIPQTHPESPLARIIKLLDINNIKRIGEIIYLFGSYMLNLRRWGLFWLILPLTAILNFNACRRRYVLATWTLLIAQIAAYMFVFVISPWSPEFLANMALERILLHVTPAVIYLIAFHMGNEVVLEDGLKKTVAKE